MRDEFFGKVPSMRDEFNYFYPSLRDFYAYYGEICMGCSSENTANYSRNRIRLWTRSGEIQSLHRYISLKYDFYKGSRRMKLLDSNEIRQLRDVCIFEVNGVEVYI